MNRSKQLFDELASQHWQRRKGISKMIRAVEVVTAVCLLLHLFWEKAGVIGGILSIDAFLTTLIFLFTSPGTFKVVDGVVLTKDFFILKDIMALVILLAVTAKSIDE